MFESNHIMIAYILHFTDKVTAHNVLAPISMSAERNNKQHLIAPDKCGFFQISAVVSRAQWNRTDPENPILTTPQVKKDGFWLLLHANRPIAEIESLAELMHACDTQDGQHSAHCEGACSMNTELMDVIAYDGLPAGVNCNQVCCQQNM